MPPIASSPPRFESLFVGRVPRGTSEERLRAAFALVGAEVGTVDMVIDRVTGLPRGFAFVSLRGRVDMHPDGLRLDLLRQATLDGVPMDIQRCRAAEPFADEHAAPPRPSGTGRSAQAHVHARQLERPRRRGRRAAPPLRQHEPRTVARADGARAISKAP